jgi:hypothetical protein
MFNALREIFRGEFLPSGVFQGVIGEFLDAFFNQIKSEIDLHISMK